jgi:intracellular sulfur oxidation DsrE/DsrF family protein
MNKSETLTFRIVLVTLIVLLGATTVGIQLWRANAPAHASNVPAVNQDFGHQKIIYHISESGEDRAGKQAGWLGSMQNHFAALKPGDLDMAVVMNGDGINLLIKAKSDPDLRSRIDKLKQQGARFLVCRNTLVSRGIDPATDLYDVKTGDLVAAGVAEIAMLESQGYGYLRP